MSFEDWVFALHLLMAATLVGSLVMSWIVVVALLSAHTPGATLSLHRVGMVGTATTVVKNGVVTVSGTVAAPSLRGGGTTEFTVELRGAVVGNAMSGVMSVRQPNGPDAAQFSALGTFKAERVPE